MNPVTATHKNQVRVKKSDNDKKWLTVDTREEAYSVEKNGFFTSYIKERDLERPPSKFYKDGNKTPFERNCQEAFSSPTNELQNEESNQKSQVGQTLLSH